MNEKEIYENWKTTPEDFKADMLGFQSWFDATDSLHSAISQGYIDFHTKILTPDVYRQIGDVRKKTCLEIGFGGGRLLNAASKIFAKSIGIDIHSCFDMTDQFLKSQGASGYELVHFDNIDKIGDESIDFAFSFIVFQHFSSIEVFYEYLKLLKRVLSVGGCCNIHLGKNKYNSEDFYLKTDIAPKTGYCSLFYRPEFVKKSLEDMGFTIMSEGQTTKLPWVLDLSSQFYVTFKK